MNLLRKTLYWSLLVFFPPLMWAQTGANASEAGRALLLRAVQYCGSPEAFKSLKVLQVQATSKMFQTAPPVEVKTDRVQVFPTRVATRMYMTGQLASEILVGEQAFHVVNGVRFELPRAEARRMRSLLWAELPFLFIHANDPSLKVEFAGTSTVEEKPVDVVLILPPGEKEVVQLYLETETGRPITLILADQSNPQRSAVYWNFGDWRKTGGLRLPHKVTLFTNDKAIQETQWDAVMINPEVDEAIFTGNSDE
ncbi:MAG: hypothetical protein JNN12_16930 [Bacteroidetes Order II. Incertae sedis bacterium]|nr:hypothetical protein [Bacteroidetes Order II. bacterium]